MAYCYSKRFAKWSPLWEGNRGTTGSANHRPLPRLDGRIATGTKPGGSPQERNTVTSLSTGAKRRQPASAAPVPAFRLGGKANRPRHARFAPPGSSGDLLLGKIELLVQEHTAFGTAEGQKDAYLAALHPACGPTILSLDLHRLESLLYKAGFAHHRRAVRVPRLLAHVAP